MTFDSLETLDDEQLQAVIARAAELIKEHDRERKEKALEDARTILAGAGLSLKNIAQANGTRARKKSAAVKRVKGKTL